MNTLFPVWVCLCLGRLIPNRRITILGKLVLTLFAALQRRPQTTMSSRLHKTMNILKFALKRLPHRKCILSSLPAIQSRMRPERNCFPFLSYMKSNRSSKKCVCNDVAATAMTSKNRLVIFIISTVWFRRTIPHWSKRPPSIYRFRARRQMCIYEVDVSPKANFELVFVLGAMLQVKRIFLGQLFHWNGSERWAAGAAIIEFIIFMYPILHWIWLCGGTKEVLESMLHANEASTNKGNIDEI